MLMVGHLLCYHPGVRQLADLIARGRARRGLLPLLAAGQPRQAARRRERALEPRRPRRLRPARAGRRQPERGLGARRGLRARGRRGRRLRPHPLRHRARRPPPPLLARPAQDAEDHRGRLRADGDPRRHGAGAQADHLGQGLRSLRRHLRRVHHPLRARSGARRCRTTSRCGSSASTSSTASAPASRPRTDGAAGVRVVRVLEALQASLDAGGAPQPVGAPVGSGAEA